MIEIAICLAIIGVALVGIIGVLPYGMNTQRDTREETVIGQDANLLIQLISSGSRGADDLTNYVYDIKKSVTSFDGTGTPISTASYDYTATSSTDPTPVYLNCGTNIIGLLSTPEFEFYTNVYGGYGRRAIPNVYQGGYSNHITAYVRAISGLAAEAPPQNNSTMLGDAFSYRLFVANAPVAEDTNTLGYAYNQNFGATLHDLRLTFLWPLLPTGNVGAGHLTFRTAVAGDLRQDQTSGLYFYGPQTFTTTP